MTAYKITFYRTGFLAKLFQADETQTKIVCDGTVEDAITKFRKEYEEKNFEIIDIKGVR